jgi:MFS family permease
MSHDSSHKVRTLTLVSVLHAFTHLYQVALMPLYLPIQKSFHLDSVGSATFMVTLMMLSYFLPSYPMGVLADRFSRKKLLGLGLAINGLGFIGLALAPSYPLALASVVVAGFGGSFFHRRRRR